MNILISGVNFVVSPKSYRNWPRLIVGHEQGSTPTKRISFPLSFWGTKGNVSPAKLLPPPQQADHDIGKIFHLRHLPFDFQPDHRLVQHDVIEHAPQRVMRIVVPDGRFHRFADGDPQAAGRIRIGRQNRASGFGFMRGTGHHVTAPHVHHRAAIGLLMVAHFDHEHLALDAKLLAGEGHGTAPLPGTGLGREAADSLDLGCSRPAARPCSSCGCPAGLWLSSLK